jgi:DNA-directed RNA polymerase specialized sigma24 family protein
MNLQCRRSRVITCKRGRSIPDVTSLSGVNKVSDAENATATAIDLERVDAARIAAANGSLVNCLEHLWASHLMDGLVRHVLRRYRDLDPDEAYTAVSEAVDDFYNAARSGKIIRNSKAWLFTVTLKRAYKIWERKSSEQPVDEHGPERSEGDVDGQKGAEREKLIRRALSIARSFLPLLGQENVRKVMEFYFDAVEKDVQHLEHSEVAEKLGLIEDTARQCAYRGFRRLKRLAEAKGINLESVIPDGNGRDTENEEGR